MASTNEDTLGPQILEIFETFYNQVFLDIMTEANRDIVIVTWGFQGQSNSLDLLLFVSYLYSMTTNVKDLWTILVCDTLVQSL